MRSLARVLGAAMLGAGYLVYFAAGLWALSLIVPFLEWWWEIGRGTAILFALMGLPAALTAIPFVAGVFYGQWQILLVEAGGAVIGFVLTRPGAALSRWGRARQ